MTRYERNQRMASMVNKIASRRAMASYPIADALVRICWRLNSIRYDYYDEEQS